MSRYFRIWFAIESVIVLEHFSQTTKAGEDAAMYIMKDILGLRIVSSRSKDRNIRLIYARIQIMLDTHKAILMNPNAYSLNQAA